MNPYSNKVFANFQFKDPETPQELLSQGTKEENHPFPVRKAKFLILLLFVILALCVSLLPWPTRIDLTMSGGRIGAEGEMIREGTVHLEGWQYNYLFRRDKMKVAVEVPDLTLPRANLQKSDYHTVLGDFRHMTQLIYVSESNCYELSHISIANDDSWCLIQIGTHLYFGSMNPNMGSRDILDACQAVIN